MNTARIGIILNKVKERALSLAYSIPDFIHYQLKRTNEPEGKHIIFVGAYMHARIARMAKWINRKSDYKCVLIAQASAFTPQLSNQSFVETQLYRNKWHLFRILKEYGGSNVIIHSFGPPHFAAYHTIKRNLSVKAEQRQKVLFDYQDLMITNFGLEAPFAYMKTDLEREKFILNNADGTISHSLELQTAKKYYGEIRTPTLFFPLYVDNDQFMNKESELGKEYHLVYAGTVYSKFQNPDYFGGQQFHWLIEKLNKQKIHFHIYPAPTNRKQELVDYIKMDQELEYFHFHESVSQDQLIKELNQYDFGIIPFFHRTNKKLNDKRYYATTLKLFNFYEAGIPVIMGEDTSFQNYIGRRYGGAISLTYEEFDDLDSILNMTNYKKLIENINRLREELSLNSYIGKLLTYYEFTN